MLQSPKISTHAFVTTVVWAALGASAVAWGLALWPQDMRPLASAVAVSAQTALPQVQASDMAKVLGATSGPAVSSEATQPAPLRFSLLGVAITQPGNALALISVDGQPAKPFHVGATVSPGWVLQAVTPTQALLGEALKTPTKTTLELPKRP